MAVAFKERVAGVLYEVWTAGGSIRLYTNGAFHFQYNPHHLFTSAVWDLLSLPSLSTDLPITKVLVLGVGGGTIIHQLDALHDIDRVVGVEMDPMHLQISQTHFSLSYAHTELVSADARDWLDQSSEQFNYIVDDVYLHGEADPHRPFFPDRQWCELLYRHLKPSGAVVQNHINSHHAQDVMRHFDQIFVRVLAYSTTLYSNAVIAGFLTCAGKAELKRRCAQRLNALPRNVSGRLRHHITQTTQRKQSMLAI